MRLTFKVNNLIINDYFKDYKGSVIETEKEDIKETRKDNFETPKSGARKKSVSVVKLKGYEQINNITIYKSDMIEDCVEFQIAFVKKIRVTLVEAHQFGLDFAVLDLENIMEKK
jgi:hypothetical protein